MNTKRLQQIKEAPDSVSVDDVLALVAELEQLARDYDGAMRRYDLQQSRACASEAESDRLKADRARMKQRAVSLAESVAR